MADHCHHPCGIWPWDFAPLLSLGIKENSVLINIEVTFDFSPSKFKMIEI